MAQEVAGLAHAPGRDERDREVNARREYGISRWRFLNELADDVKALSPGIFKRKHGVDVRECRRALKRLRELAAEGPAEDDMEVQKLVVLFAALWDRKMTS